MDSLVPLYSRKNHTRYTRWIIYKYRFWILLYICAIYIYIVKNLIWPKNANEFLSYLSELLFTPLKTLDHFIKYNVHTKTYYYRVMESFIDKVDNFSSFELLMIFFIFQILPRCILILFLMTDTFYFLKLELMYKVLLIGILPMNRYVLYCIKDLYNHCKSALPCLTYNDYKEIHKLFLELMPKILELKTTVDSINTTKEHIALKWSKVVIFSLYFLCWSFILTISYYVYPWVFLCLNIFVII